jgi:hypothetical protein
MAYKQQRTISHIFGDGKFKIKMTSDFVSGEWSFSAA